MTPKQRQFVQEYLIDLNATQAAIRAGYSEKTAEQIGFENLRKPQIAEAIEQAMAKRSQRTEITQDMVLQELAKIGFADLRKAVKWGSSVAVNDETGEQVAVAGIVLAESSDIDDLTAAAISEVSQTKEGLKIKFHDKHAALVSIGKHLGMFRDRVELTGKDGAPIHSRIETIDPNEAAKQYAKIIKGG